MTDLFTQDDKSDIAAYIPGESNRYKTIEDLAKGKYESDTHIKRIEEENKQLRETNLQLREDNQTKAKLEEYLDRISSSTARTNPASDGTTNNQPGEQPFDLSQVESLFEKKWKEREVSKTKEQNVKLVTDALKERHGHNYLDVLNKQTEDLGLSKEAVNYLAENSPKALMKQLGLTEAPKADSFSPPPRQSALFSTKPSEKRTWSYYQKLRKDQPEIYRNPQTQVQMQKDYMTYGKEFEDGDFLYHGQDSAF